MIDQSNNYDEMNQGIDRITEILKRQSSPSQGSGLPNNILNALASASYDYGNGGGNFIGNVQKYQANQQNQELNQQEGLLKAYEMKLRMGDAQAKALDQKLSLFTGDDADGKALFLQALHDDPDPIDPSNSYQVMTKLAGIKKRLGYESPDLTMQKQKDQLDIDLKKAQIGATNALATNRTSSSGDNKPIPASALRMQQEGLDAIGTAASIEADLGNVINSLDSGNLELGPVENLISSGRNTLGISSKNSQNFATFKATLEKLRNDSLRLNKGVQTEGDSQRAWNEILTNINDPKLVKQRLKEVQEINRRAASLQEMNVNMIRQNYGYDPVDASGYTNQKSAILLDESDPRIQKARDAGYSDEEIKKYLEGQ